LFCWYWLKGEKVTVLDMPLLIESGMHHYMSAVVVVYCSEQLQLIRLMERENFPETTARQRIEAQMPLKEKVQYADYIIDNSGELVETERQVDQVMEKIQPTLWNWLLTWLGPPTVALGCLLTVAQKGRL